MSPLDILRKVTRQQNVVDQELDFVDKQKASKSSPTDASKVAAVQTLNPEAKALPVPPVQLVVNPYYVDTIAKATEDPTVNLSTTANFAYTPVADAVLEEGSSIPEEHKGVIEVRYEKLSLEFDQEILKDNPNFDVLMGTILKLFGYQMRTAAKEDQERVFEYNEKIHVQSHEIKNTYNKWHGMTITVISGTISIAGGLAGLTPLLSANVIDPGMANYLQHAATPISQAGTGVGSFSTLVNNQSEGQRTVMQIYLKRFQDSEQENKDKKHTHKQHVETVRNLFQEFNRNKAEAIRAMG